MTERRAAIPAMLLVSGLLLTASPGRAADPWRVMGDGVPMTWDQAQPVPFRIDAGSLGKLTHAQAEEDIAAALAAWNAVGVLALAVDGANPLPDITADGDISNPAHYLNFWDALALAPDKAVKVIFDADGSIVEDMFGTGARDDFLGLARIDTPTPTGPQIAESSILINGAAFDGTLPDLGSRQALRSVMVHEIGHAINLGHSALNRHLAGDGDPHNDRYLPSMFPLLVDDEGALATLNPDDEAAIKLLYSGEADSMSGEVTHQSSSFQGAQIVVRRVDSPPAPQDARLLEAYSATSGAFFFPGPGPPPPPELLGAWRIKGLPAGDYEVCVEQIDRSFSEHNGSLVGALATPPLLPGPAECYDASEAGTTGDDPDNAMVLTAPGPHTNIDIALNAMPVGLDPGDPSSHANDTPGTATALTGPGDTTYGILDSTTLPELDFFSIPVNVGDRLVVDVDAAELGYGVDLVAGLYNDAGLPVLDGGVPLVRDDAVDAGSRELSTDPHIEWVVGFNGLARVGISCYPDLDLTGCDTPTDAPYWIRLEVHGDGDGDGTVDDADACPGDPFNDLDDDGVCAAAGDRCPTKPGKGSINDGDADGVADECDLCPAVGDPDQGNADNDEFGDACDLCTDSDGDGRGDPGFAASLCALDNCPSRYNPGQIDTDTDGRGDACDPCPSDPLDGCLDVTPPAMFHSLPLNGQTGVSTSSDILLYLTGPVDPSTVDSSSVVLETGGGKVDATPSITGGHLIQLDPESTLATGTEYVVRVRPPLSDLAGNEIVEQMRNFWTLGRGDAVTTDDIGTDPPGSSAGGGPGDEAGFSVAILGDVNGDGFVDSVYGSPGADDLAPGGGKVTLTLGGTGAPGGGPASIDFIGADVNQHVGRSVADAGDLNGDGLADFAFSASDPLSGPSRVWVVYGNVNITASSPDVDLGSSELSVCLPLPTDEYCGSGFVTPNAQRAGTSLSRAEDMNGDGVGELMIGAPGATVGMEVGAGKVYMVFGNAANLLEGNTFDLADTGTGTLPGIVFEGEAAGDSAGQSVSLWSDEDLGGLNDILIGAPLADTIDRHGVTVVDGGYVYAIHPVSSLPSTVALSSVGINPVPPGISGVVFLGTEPGGSIGRSVSGAVDFDGDGVPDFLFAGNGLVYAVKGEGGKGSFSDNSGSGDRALLDGGSGATALRQEGGTNAFNDIGAYTFVQDEPPPLRPLVVAGGGDLNGDGFGDFLIGDPDNNAGTGTVYVVYGRPGGWDRRVPLSQIGGTVPGLRIDAGTGVTELGASVDGGGDLNGDCLDDAVIGAPGGDGSVFWLTVLTLDQNQNMDADGDGADACEDCDDGNPSRFPQSPAGEICDGFDNDCNGVVDDTGDPDGDLDGVHACLDCNDAHAQQYPGNPEVCDELDNDCNGIADDTADDDLDGYSACSDCDDTDPTAFPANPESCDTVDNDCDGFVDEDGDGDGFAICSDCDDLVPGAYATPGEVLNLRFDSASDLAWDAPSSPGGAGIRYDTIRSGDPQDLVSGATCVETDDAADTVASDADLPIPGAAFYYVVRAENGCPSSQGSIGEISGGTPRSAGSCPP